MTIIKPNMHQGLKTFFISLFLLIFIGGGVYIFEYNALVDSRFQIEKLRESLIGLQAKNADFKNELYRIVDPAKFESVAGEEGLIMDRRPGYLENSQWLSDSSH